MAHSTGVQRPRSRAETARRAALLRAEQRRRRHRQRVLTVVGSAVGVLAIVAVLVVVAVTSGGKAGAQPRRTAPPGVVAAVTGMPAATLATIGSGTAKPPTPVSDPPLTANGHPQVLYVGAEYCPYCAAERWALVQAMSRFGTWSDLKLTTSGANEVFPNTPTFSFYGARYTSDYLTFTGKELFTNEPVGNKFKPLEKLTKAESDLFYSHTNGFPFTDLGGAYAIAGASFDPGVLKGLTASQIASALRDPTDPVAKAVGGAANGITAALCKVTGGQPATVCEAPAVKAISGRLGA